jgi:hypothetical protein
MREAEKKKGAKKKKGIKDGGQAKKPYSYS